MPSAARSPASNGWRQLASLGEQLLTEPSLSAQHDRITSMTGRLIEGKVDVWLHENVFRLPDWDKKGVFSPSPPLEGMRLALKAGRTYVSKSRGKHASRRTFVAVPIEDQGFKLGALQVSRRRGPEFRPEELDLLEVLARIVAAGLFASHRAEVERFRLGQLNLVRQVSAQIANVLEVDELAKRVTELIQHTFHYYYVAIFTLEPDSQSLRFRSSASAPRKGKKKASLALQVEVGQGLIGEAALGGEQILCDDVRADPRFRFIDSLPETRSEVVIPLRIEEQVLGILDVQSDRLRAFHPNDLLVLSTLADNTARAVEGARLYSGMRRRADQLTLVSEVSRSVTSTLELSELMSEAATLIHDRFGYPNVSLFTVHPNRRLIEYEGGSGKRSRKLAGYSISLDDPHGIIPWVARQGKTVLANDVSQDARYRPSPLPPRNTRSELTIPLTFNEIVLGVLDIQSDKLNAFSEDDQTMFEAVAGTMAAAIRNADLYRSEQWRRQVSDSLHEVAGLLSANVGVDEVLEAILVELERNLPVDVAAIWLVGDGDLYLAAVHGTDPQALEQAWMDSPEASSALMSALLSTDSVIRKPDDPVMASGIAAGFGRDHSSLTAPLRLADQPLGVITLAHKTAGRYGHEAQAMTTTLASYAAVAIENARLYDAAQEQAYAAAALLQVAQAVVSLSDLAEILGSIIRIMPILVGVERVLLFLWDAQREVFVASQEYGFSEQEQAALTEREFKPGSFPLLDAARQENHLLTHLLNARATPRSWLRIRPQVRETETHLQSEGRLLMTFPLAIKNDLYGVLMVEEADNGRRFRSRRIEILNGIAQQAALAIQNDRLQQEMVVRERLETEVQLARQIQQTFIPEKLPTFDDWQLAARWRTARQVGGDFYDVIELPNRKLGLFIADVADKGVPAALFMALTRTLMRAAVIETDSPAEALRRVNDLLLPDTRQGMFVTAVYGVLDIVGGEFTFANAGHNPPIWIRHSGEMERLTRTAVALGVMEQAEMTQRTISLARGDRLFLYTDGLTEAFSSEGEFFGETRLLDTLRSIQTATLEELLARVESRLTEFTDPLPPADDLTMLAVRRV
jgi:sigma-B regulation protein RsbU (phosphoserine phosphatase)